MGFGTSSCDISQGNYTSFVQNCIRLTRPQNIIFALECRGQARAFTTFFSFNGRVYTAVITQFDGTTHIYLPDESLHTILPEGRATYRKGQQLKTDGSRYSPDSLIDSALKSIEEKKKQ